jgi:hypothetical protein
VSQPGVGRQSLSVNARTSPRASSTPRFLDSETLEGAFETTRTAIRACSPKARTTPGVSSVDPLSTTTTSYLSAG